MVPEGWRKTTVGDSLNRVSRPVDVEPSEEYRQIGIRSHGKGLFDKDHVTGVELGDKRVFWIEPDCFVVNIVFAWEQAVGRTTIADVGKIASHRFPMYRPKNDQCDVRFIEYFFKSPRGKYLLGIASPGGAGRNKTLGQKEFDSVPLNLPPLPEQRKIADILSTWDAAIEKTEALLATAKAQKRALMQSLLTGKRRFPEFEGQPCKEVLLGDVCQLQTGPFGSQLKAEEYSAQKKGVAVVMPKSLINGSVDFSVCDFIDQERSDDLLKHRLYAGDLLFSRRGDVARTALITDADGACICGTGCLRARPATLTLGRFLSKLLQMEACRGWLEDNAVGQTMLNLNTKIIGALPIQVPSGNEQNKIVAVFDVADALIEEHRFSIEKLRTEKKALMQQLLTGKRRVTVEDNHGI